MKFGIKLTPDLMPCIIKDADGLEVMHAIEGDTETGICWVILTGLTGMPIKGKKGVVHVEKKFKQPLQIEPLTQQGWEYLRWLEACHKQGNLRPEEQGKVIIL